MIFSLLENIKSQNVTETVIRDIGDKTLFVLIGKDTYEIFKQV